MAKTAINPKALGVDAIALGVLVAAVVAVFLLDNEAPVPAPNPVPPAPVIKPMRLAVIPQHAQFDDMGSLLDSLGPSYSYRPVGFDEMLKSESLEKWDIVFVTCSGYPENWLAEDAGGQRRGGNLRRPNEETLNQAKRALRKFAKSRWGWWRL
jgi:hypothetical protein